MTPRTRAERIAGLEGPIVGMSLERRPGNYAVSIAGRGSWLVHESELETTGVHAKAEACLDGPPVVRLVASHPATG